MEDIQHRIIWARIFAFSSILLGLVGIFSFGISSFIGAIIGFAATREKAIGKTWLVSAWVGIAICVAYFITVFTLSVAWHE